MSRGRIITFYSFKGGVGRSMALANIGVLLARRGRRVLCVDWDLEAAGLHRYFQQRLPEGHRPVRGLLDLAEGTAEWKELTTPIPFDGFAGSLDLLPAGSGADDYVRRVQAFDWSRAYEAGLGNRLEAVREEWAESYDVVLVDSRTGLSDIGGICTIQLPDILVMMFSANRQSLDGTLDVARRVEQARRELPVTRSTLMILPLPSRFEGRTEVDQAQHWLKVFAEELEPLYENWLDASIRPAEILRYTRLPAVPRWSFEESLPVLVEDAKDADTISYAFEASAVLLERGLEGSAELVKERGSFVAEPTKWDFGLMVFGRPTGVGLLVAAHLREQGHSSAVFDEWLRPGDEWGAAVEEFFASSSVVVAFYVGEQRHDATDLVRRARDRGLRFVPVLAPPTSRRPHGLGDLVVEEVEPPSVGGFVERLRRSLGRSPRISPG